MAGFELPHNTGYDPDGYPTGPISFTETGATYPVYQEPAPTDPLYGYVNTIADPVVDAYLRQNPITK